LSFAKQNDNRIKLIQFINSQIWIIKVILVILTRVFWELNIFMEVQEEGMEVEEEFDVTLSYSL